MIERLFGFAAIFGLVLLRNKIRHVAGGSPLFFLGFGGWEWHGEQKSSGVIKRLATYYGISTQARFSDLVKQL